MYAYQKFIMHRLFVLFIINKVKIINALSDSLLKVKPKFNGICEQVIYAILRFGMVNGYFNSRKIYLLF
jgi:hypothetical protein